LQVKFNNGEQKYISGGKIYWRIYNEEHKNLKSRFKNIEVRVGNMEVTTPVSERFTQNTVCFNVGDNTEVNTAGHNLVTAGDFFISVPRLTLHLQLHALLG